MTDLIEVMRGYESYQKIIRTLDENNAKLIAGVGNPL
jgi:flagellar basal body rod protein FlgG